VRDVTAMSRPFVADLVSAGYDPTTFRTRGARTPLADRLDAAAASLGEVARAMRADILHALTEARSGHPGGSLSAIDIVAALYLEFLRHDANDPDWTGRDRFVLSKGHGVPALYTTLAWCGYFPRSELMTLRKLGARLQGHPVRGTVPGIEACTGSLGQGLSIAQGLALGQRMASQAAGLARAAWPMTWCMVGDGEIQEGQIWEAALSAPKFRLDNLVAILDYNGGQIDGPTAEVMPLDPIADKWRAFGWRVLEMDGHDPRAILTTLDAARQPAGLPTFVVAHTVKGKGVSFMEHPTKWHGVAPTPADCERAIAELLGH